MTERLRINYKLEQLNTGAIDDQRRSITLTVASGSVQAPVFTAGSTISSGTGGRSGAGTATGGRRARAQAQRWSGGLLVSEDPHPRLIRQIQQCSDPVSTGNSAAAKPVRGRDVQSLTEETIDITSVDVSRRRSRVELLPTVLSGRTPRSETAGAVPRPAFGRAGPAATRPAIFGSSRANADHDRLRRRRV
jgi:hypothetical protein